MTKKRSDIVVVGGGLIGLCLALILGKLNFKVILIDKEDIIKKDNIEKDSRTVAVSLGTKLFLEEHKIWRNIGKYAQPIEKIRVLNRNSKSSILFNNDIAMGHIVENKVIKKELVKKIISNKNIKFINAGFVKKTIIKNNLLSVFTNKNIEICSKLLIAADGKNSFLKKFYDIPSYDIKYDQSALVMNLVHSENHNNTAYEIFLPNGPLATLPMRCLKKDIYKSSLIWTEKKSTADDLLKLNHSYLKEIIEEKVAPYLGKINRFESLKKFNLTAHICRRFYDKRIIFVGDSAHSIHPIAGQGWNLGMRDIKYLIKILKDSSNYGLDIGSSIALKEYSDTRFADVSSMLFITHGLNKIFSSKLKFINSFRSFGFNYINNKKYLNQSLVNYATGINL